MHKYRKHRIPIIKRHLGSHQKSILDFGCGSGEVIYLLQESGFAVDGFDPSKKAVSSAKKYLKSIRLFSSLGDLDNKYDAITSFSVLQYSENKSEQMEKMVGMLKIGGKLFIGTPKYFSLYALLRRNFTPKEWEYIPKESRLKLVSVEAEVPSYLYDYSSRITQIVKWGIYGMAKFLSIFNIRVHSAYVHVFEKVK
ncbi:MAG: class I SAM-dependent methyltransferase [Candidatus Margulisbacteria bacterium]|nr:class I SAM-dependent methyltransferase [Candidatus Margulisiibacteriota bacterium]